MAKKTKAVKVKPVAKKKAVAVKKAAPAKKAVVLKKAAAKKAPVKAVVAKKAPKAAQPVVKKAAAKGDTKTGKAKATPVPAKSAKPEKIVKPQPAPEKVKGKVKEVEIAPVEVAPEEVDDSEAEIVLTDAEGRRYCRVKDCDQLSSVDGYCRYHYLLYWKKIQVRKKILTEGKLERYVEELTARYPDKFLDVLRKDLRSEKEFLAAIQELEIDESAGENEFEEEAQTYIDEVRGMGEPAAREEEDF